MFIFAAAMFLSRLCGGEEGAGTTWTPPVFLSRLCGGEVQLLRVQGTLSFLSRLCGGEAEPMTPVTRTTFSKPPMWR